MHGDPPQHLVPSCAELRKSPSRGVGLLPCSLGCHQSTTYDTDRRHRLFVEIRRYLQEPGEVESLPRISESHRFAGLFDERHTRCVPAQLCVTRN